MPTPLEVNVLAVDYALDGLAAFYRPRARVAGLRFFAGFVLGGNRGGGARVVIQAFDPRKNAADTSHLIGSPADVERVVLFDVEHDVLEPDVAPATARRWVAINPPATGARIRSSQSGR